MLKMYSWARNSLLLAVLFGIVLLVNIPVIQYDMMYCEQSMIYLANQAIHSLADLANAYLHPKLLDMAVPFFRPSGHFLIYQLLMPILGWHNTRAMLIVNLLFLALSGFVMIKLYELFFPRYRMGGYIAFGLYAMQPAMILSRLTVMHFEFAYVFFVLLSLYCFALFFKNNNLLDAAASHSSDLNKLKLTHMKWIGLSILFFVIAATFKEPSLMLGPVLVSYLLIILYERQSLRIFIRGIVSNNELLQIILLMTVTTLFLVCYLTLAWPGLTNPERISTQWTGVWGAIQEYAKIIFSFNYGAVATEGLYSPTLPLRHLIVPIITRLIMWTLFVSMAGSFFILSRQPANHQIDLLRKSVVFLFVASLLFLILPVSWATGLPWHLSLSFVCLSLMLGFGCDYFILSIVKNKQSVLFSEKLLLILIGISAFVVNQDNIRYLTKTNEGRAYALNRNAVLHPPALQALLNEQSVLVVEDSEGAGDYALGDGGYPFFVVADFDYDQFQKKQQYRFVKYQPQYNGTLFRWAYLMPNLQEEYFPFRVSEMKNISDVVIYDWLQHGDNIFCVGYDAAGVWFDRTVIFKKNLLIEKNRRHLVIHPYRVLPATALVGTGLSTQKVSLPDATVCQWACDQDKNCKGFTYIHVDESGHSKSACYYYHSLALNSTHACAVCAAYVKTMRSNL